MPETLQESVLYHYRTTDPFTNLGLYQAILPRELPADIRQVGRLVTRIVRQSDGGATYLHNP